MLSYTCSYIPVLYGNEIGAFQIFADLYRGMMFRIPDCQSGLYRGMVFRGPDYQSGLHEFNLLIYKRLKNQFS